MPFVYDGGTETDVATVVVVKNVKPTCVGYAPVVPFPDIGTRNENCADVATVVELGARHEYAQLFAVAPPDPVAIIP